YFDNPLNPERIKAVAAYPKLAYKIMSRNGDADKKIWITEMANWNAQINSYAKQEAQMQSMVDTCERREDVFRYAWFIGRGSGTDSHYSWLYTSTAGQLSELGQMYISLPFDTVKQSQ
ncbi:MAG: hypothetical protein EHM64_07115, partial [Ignavibacteriae bacterium]